MSIGAISPEAIFAPSSLSFCYPLYGKFSENLSKVRLSFVDESTIGSNLILQRENSEITRGASWLEENRRLSIFVEQPTAGRKFLIVLKIMTRPSFAQPVDRDRISPAKKKKEKYFSADWCELLAGTCVRLSRCYFLWRGTSRDEILYRSKAKSFHKSLSSESLK